MATVKEDQPLCWAPGVTLSTTTRAGRERVQVAAPGGRGALTLDTVDGQLAKLINGHLSATQLLAKREFRGADMQARARAVLVRLEQAGLLDRHRGVAFLAGDASRTLQRELRWGQLTTSLAGELDDDAIAALSAAAPDTDCGSCVLDCCRFNVGVGRAEVMPLCQATASTDLRPADIFADASQQDEHSQLIELRRREDGSCAMLDPNGRCQIHAAAGLHAKPTPCQLYPAIPILLPGDAPSSSARLGLRPGCPHAASVATDHKRAAYQQTLRQVRATRPSTLIRRAPSQVVVHSQRPAMPWAAYDAWEQDAVQIAGQTTHALAAVRSLWQSLEQWQDLAATDTGPPPRTGSPPANPIAIISRQLAELLDHSTTPEDATPIRCLPDASMSAAMGGERSGSLDGQQRAEQVGRSVSGLELLRWPSVAAGLGVLTLAVGAAERDHRRPPPERLAYWFRVFDRWPIRRHLAMIDVKTLEVLAGSGSLDRPPRTPHGPQTT